MQGWEHEGLGLENGWRGRNERDITFGDQVETQFKRNSYESTSMTAGKIPSNCVMGTLSAISYNQIGDYPNCHQRTFIQ